MERRDFLGAALAGSFFWNGEAAQGQVRQGGEPFIERDAQGKPHAGKVLAAIQPHSDDITIFAAGVVAKLLNEGYTGYLIRTTNDAPARAASATPCWPTSATTRRWRACWG